MMQQLSSHPINRRRFLRVSAGAGLLAVGGQVVFPGGLNAQDSEHAGLKVLSESPMNAEPALEDLIQDWMTPIKYFYVRSHAPNPKVNLANYRLKVEGLVEKPLSLSLAELNERFDKQSITATMTCAGNRRAEYNEVQKVGGVQWGPGAVGNARWGGVKLSEILNAAGLKEDAKHIWFEGLDEIPHGGGTIPFGGSIPVTKALADTESMPGALLSFEMNEVPLTADHGYPLRAAVPGYIGARSVKWLGKITVSNRPSPNHYVADAYKLVIEDTPLAWDEAGVIYNYLVNSVIAEPRPNAKLSAGRTKVKGYALPAGDGSHITKVEVSANTGRSWTIAKLLTKAQPYCWVLWEANVPIMPGTTQLVVKATDSKGNTQPRTVPWNMKGYMNNSWFDLPVNVGS